MSLFGNIEKLITEHGSANILRERLLLAQDKYSTLEQRNKELQEENLQLKAEIKGCKERIKSYAGVAEAIEDLSDDDILSMMESWFRSLPPDKALSVIHFSEVDKQLKLKTGTAKRLLHKSIEGLDGYGYPLVVKRVSKNTILFKQKAATGGTKGYYF